MKESHAKAIRARLNTALQNLYHNATPHYVSVPENISETYFQVFNDAAAREIEYISEGLGLTDEDWLKAVKLGFLHNERYFWLVQRITESGQLNTYGRGGRTLAPSKLMRGHLTARPCTDNDLDYLPWSAIVDMIQVIEAFNHYVEQWCSKENQQAIWQDYIDNIDNNCPGCENPPTEALWTTPLALMCKDCKALLSDNTAS